LLDRALLYLIDFATLGITPMQIYAPRTKSLQKHPSFAIGGLPSTPDSNPRAPRRSPSTSHQPGLGFILDAMDVDPDNGVTFEPSRTENSCQVSRPSCFKFRNLINFKTELSDAELQNQALREQVESLNGDVRRLKGDFDKVRDNFLTFECSLLDYAHRKCKNTTP
jgi:hypothetical protein